MPSGRLKSNRFRKVFVRTPGGKVTIHYRQRKPSKARCAIYGTVLSGVAHDTHRKVKNMAKSKKIPSRPFAGVLSSPAMRDVMKLRAREMQEQ
jgi:large subunit ribosomal protein L34e